MKQKYFDSVNIKDMSKSSKTVKYNEKKSNNQNLLFRYRLMGWFSYHMVNSKKVCENCGRSLENLNDREWHGSQHHILEKNLFKSVATELENHAVLGYYCCHPQIHTSYENAQKMPIWNTLKERVRPILHLVKEKHKILELFK